MCTLVERYLLQEEKINASSLIQIKIPIKNGTDAIININLKLLKQEKNCCSNGRTTLQKKISPVHRTETNLFKLLLVSY